MRLACYSTEIFLTNQRRTGRITVSHKKKQRRGRVGTNAGFRELPAGCEAGNARFELASEFLR